MASPRRAHRRQRRATHPAASRADQREVEAMKMQTADLAQLKRDATDKIIFHATPREWLRRARPLGARPRRGSAPLRRGRPRIPRRPLRGRLRGARRLRARGDRAGDVRAGPAAAVHQPVRDDERRHRRAGAQARRADTRRPGGHRSSATAARRRSRRRSSSPASTTRRTARAAATRSSRCGAPTTARPWARCRRRVGAPASASSVAAPTRSFRLPGSRTPCRPTATAASWG